jgi:hypothetical protein
LETRSGKLPGRQNEGIYPPLTSSFPSGSLSGALTGWISSPEGLSTARLKFQHEHSSFKNLRLCSLVPISAVGVTYSGAGVAGTLKCKNPLCSICGAKRQRENASLMEKVISSSSGVSSFYIGTLTLPTRAAVAAQVGAFQKCWRRFIKVLRDRVRRRGSKVHVAWSFDLTLDLEKGRAHCHRHFIARLTSGTPDAFDLHEMIWQIWRDTALKILGKTLSYKAFYCEPISSGASAAARYVYKSAAEEMSCSLRKKQAFNGRMGWLQFLNFAANNPTPKLVALYEEIVAAFRGRRFFGIPDAFNAVLDGLEDDLEDELEGKRKEAHARIAPIQVPSLVHQQLLRAGAYYDLLMVLKTGSDSDLSVRNLKKIITSFRDRLSVDSLDLSSLEDLRVAFLMWKLSL